MNKINQTAKLYNNVTITDAELEANVSVGDFSKVHDSHLKMNVRIDRNNHIDSSNLGRHSYTGRNTIILHTDIGSFCSISWNVSIGGANHDYSRTTQHSFLYNKDNGLIPESSSVPYDRFLSNVTIGSDVWIAAGAVITRNVTIGDGAVIGANAVVTKDVPPYAIVVGAPAKIIKYRFDPDIIKRLLEIKWWNWPDKKIRANFSILADQPTIENLKGL